MSIKLENVSYQYASTGQVSVHALDGVSLTVKEGEIVALMGRTGCGKSTLAQVIAGLIKPDGGCVFVDESDINDPDYDRKILRRNVGIVFQYPENQLFETTVYRDVGFGLKHSGLSAEEKDRNIRRALEMTGFDPDMVSQWSPLSMSGGEKRRLAIAGVLAVDPKYLILDEPIAGLDPDGRSTFLTMLRQMRQEGKSVIMISHNADAVAECADRVVLMAMGQIVKDGPLEEVFGDEEAMEECGASLSAPGRIARLLRERGMEIPAGTVTYEGLRDDLLKRAPRRSLPYGTQNETKSEQ